MANAAGYVQESIWRDPHWRTLSRSAQALYMQLLSQKELDCAGILPLQPNKWAKGCEGMSVEDVWADLEELQRERFVFYDTDTDEAFIRTYIRNSNVLKVPNMRKSARRSAALVGSEVLRPVLAAELRATADVELVAAADEIDPEGAVAVDKPVDKNPSGKGSRRVTRTVREPFGEPTGVGVGVGVSHLRSNQVGEEPPACKKHPNGNPDDEPCRGCQRIREWGDAKKAAEKTSEADRKRALYQRGQGCPVCKGTNWVPDTEPAVKCDHEGVV